MKFLQLRRSMSYGIVAITVASSVFLASCGGGGGGGSTQSAGIGGTGIVAGKTTGFGSIYVNGDRYTTLNSKFIVDGDDTLTEDDLEVGMYVRLRVKTLDGNFTGEALEVIYDDEVQGPVVGILPACPCPGETQRTFSVYGQNVTIDETSTIFDGTSFEGLSNGDLVEISGFRTADDKITATYVEDKGPLVLGSEVELRGIITGYTAGMPESFGITTAPGITIEVGGGVVKDPPGLVLQDNLYVEVEATYDDLDPSTVQAVKIEEEDDDLGSDLNDISLQGVISNFTSVSDFEIDGQPINAFGATPMPANALTLLDNGVEVEVEGNIDGFGVLIADELELRDGDSELRTTIKTRDLGNSRIELEFPGFGDDTLGTVWVNVDGQTLFEDESVANQPNLSLDLLMVGDFVKVKGIANLSGINPEVDAEIIKRRDPDSTRLEGVVEAKVKPVSITILGIAYPVDPAATYEDENGTPMSANDFFDAIVVDTSVVELEDDDLDADADEVEFDD